MIILAVVNKQPKNHNNREPANWRDIYDNIKLMRQTKNAPVDTMGCAECGKC